MKFLIPCVTSFAAHSNRPTPLTVLLLGAVALLGASRPANASIIVHTSDFIDDSSRTHFNGFEGLPTTDDFYQPSGPYTEDSISVQQVNADGSPYDESLWVTYSAPGLDGDYAWYPNGGDRAYTVVTLFGGGDVERVGFNYTSPALNFGSPTGLLYELLDDGNVVLSGLVEFDDYSEHYLGFSGGGFDTLRLRQGVDGTVTDGMRQYLAIDNIETSGTVPEPTSLALLGMGGLGLLGYGRRRFRSSQHLARPAC